MTGCFRQWEYPLVFGEEQVKYTKVTVSSRSSLALKGTCFARSAAAICHTFAVERANRADCVSTS